MPPSAWPLTQIACPVPMSRRSRAREVALQILFEDDVNPRDSLPDVESFLAARIKNDELQKFALSLIQGVRRNQGDGQGGDHE